MRKTERHDMRVDDGEHTVIHHGQRHHDTHEPSVFADGLGHGPRMRVMKDAEGHDLEVTDSRRGEKWKSQVRPHGSTSR